MKKVLKGILLMGTMTIGLNANCVATGCYGVTVDALYVAQNGTIVVVTSGDESALSSTACPPSLGANHMTVSYNVPGKNALYAMLLTAQTTKKIINLRLDESGTDCSILYAALEK